MTPGDPRATPVPWPLPKDDPYLVLARLREGAPVHRVPGVGVLVVDRRRALDVLGDPGSWSSDPGGSAVIPDALRGLVVFSDPPEHTRRRRALGGQLSRPAVAQLADLVDDVVALAVEAAQGAAGLDVAALARMVPVAVAVALLGVDPATAVAIEEELPALVSVLDPLAGEPERRRAEDAGARLLVELVPAAVRARTVAATPWLAELAGGGRDAGELVAHLVLVLAAGQETVANLVANAVVLLHDRPDLCSGLRRSEGSLPAAVEELARVEPPVQLVGRRAVGRRQLADVVVEPDEPVLVSLAAANRDPEHFPDPDHVDPERRGPAHLAFGHGIHFCAGAALARLEVMACLRSLLSLTPALESRPLRLVRGTSPTFRRIDTLLLG